MITLQGWPERRDRHRRRVEALLGPYLRDRARGLSHPVIDFLFTYYNLAPGGLLRWHPGSGVALDGPEAEDYAGLRGYRRTALGVAVDPAFLVKRRSTVDYVVRLLTVTAGRPARFDCFGLHEWAMVYRADPADIRHRMPLRLGAHGTDEVVESLPLRCTHYDAFRFFTPSARPRNADELSRDAQVATEQPGCLHAGMDLYKYAAKLLPLVDSDLLWETFELAFAARVLDMRASPYDLTGLGYEPVCIDTAAGRADYVRRQSDLAERGGVVRAKLLECCRALQTA